MNVLFIHEAVYLEFNGKLYSSRIEYKTYWRRFLEHFDHVTIMARVKKVQSLPSQYHISTGERVDYISLGYYNGLIGYWKNRGFVDKTIEEHIFDYTAYVFRVPSRICTIAFSKLKRRNRRYAVEVVGDPYEVSKYLPIIYPLKLIIGYLSFYQMKKIVRRASAVLYVTEKTLQRRYPASDNAFSIFASDVLISDSQSLPDLSNRQERILTLPSRLKGNNEIVRIGVIGMLYPIKAPLDIIKAVKIVIDLGLNVWLEFVGEGPMIADIEELAKSLNISDRVVCLGTMNSGSEIFHFLDTTDLYIQFSKTEGMPRSMIEAMSRGCPVIGSSVGGIPELISQDLLVKSGDYQGLANKIIWLLNDTLRVQRAALENFEKAKEFLDSKLQQKRLKFYSHVRSLY